MEALLDAIKDQPLALLAFGAVVALIFGVRHLGLWQGQKAVSAPPESATAVAAVIVDPTALVAATEALERHTKATNRLADNIDDLGRGVTRLTDELIRSAAKLT